MNVRQFRGNGRRARPAVRTAERSTHLGNGAKALGRACFLLVLFPLVACGQSPGDTFRDCPECPEMVEVPAGSFEMGSRLGDDDERRKPPPAARTHRRCG